MGYGSDSDRFGKKLFSTDGVDFVIPVSEEMASWWESRFMNFGLTQKDICDKLIADLPISSNYKIAAINPAKDYVCVEITGSDDVGIVFLTARSIEFQERQVHLNMTEVRADQQGLGYGTTLARNCYRLARTLDMERLGPTSAVSA